MNKNIQVLLDVFAAHKEPYAADTWSKGRHAGICEAIRIVEDWAKVIAKTAAKTEVENVT